MTWMNNLILYHDTGNAGKCPKCKSEEIEVTKHNHGSRTSVTFKCEKCGSSDHFDGFSDTRNK